MELSSHHCIPIHSQSTFKWRICRPGGWFQLFIWWCRNRNYSSHVTIRRRQCWNRYNIKACKFGALWVLVVQKWTHITKSWYEENWFNEVFRKYQRDFFFKKEKDPKANQHVKSFSHSNVVLFNRHKLKDDMNYKNTWCSLWGRRRWFPMERWTWRRA